MIESLLLSLAAAMSSPTTTPATTAKQPTLYCREVIEGPSASQSLKICRTKAQWQRHDSCNGSVTRYCEARRKAALPAGATVGEQTAFALSEDSRIVCRVMSITGTRVRQSQVCLPKREWDRMWQDASRNTFKAQDWSKLVGPDQ